jgi:hypothetical protein
VLLGFLPDVQALLHPALAAETPEKIHRSLERNEPAALLKSRELSAESGRLKPSIYKQISSRSRAEKPPRTGTNGGRCGNSEEAVAGSHLGFSCLPACLPANTGSCSYESYHSASRAKIKPSEQSILNGETPSVGSDHVEWNGSTQTLPHEMNLPLHPIPQQLSSHFPFSSSLLLQLPQSSRTGALSRLVPTLPLSFPTSCKLQATIGARPWLFASSFPAGR